MKRVEGGLARAWGTLGSPCDALSSSAAAAGSDRSAPAAETPRAPTSHPRTGHLPVLSFASVRAEKPLGGADGRCHSSPSITLVRSTKVRHGRHRRPPGRSGVDGPPGSGRELLTGRPARRPRRVGPSVPARITRCSHPQPASRRGRVVWSPPPTGSPPTPGRVWAPRAAARSTPRSPRCSSRSSPSRASCRSAAAPSSPSRRPGDAAVTVDGYVEMPGRGLPPSAFRKGTRELYSAEYAGGTSMTIGHGTVGTPGMLPAFEEAHRRYGHVPWRVLVEPAVEISRGGFPLGAAANYYLGTMGTELLADDAEALGAVKRPDGTVKGVGETVVIPHLAGFLELVAAEGSAALFPARWRRCSSTTWRRTAAWSRRPTSRRTGPSSGRRGDRAGRGLDDRHEPAAGHRRPRARGDADACSTAIRRTSGRTTTSCGGSPCSVRCCGTAPRSSTSPATAPGAGQALLDGVLAGGQKWLGVAPSTAHVSVVDAEGFACSVTASSGYGAGVSIPGTGVWLNNCLGEHELNRAGLHTLAPGERLASNMAPSVARRPDGAVLAIGSPGADRITTALAQVLASFAHGGYDLQQAIDRPRVHLSRAPPTAPRCCTTRRTSCSPRRSTCRSRSTRPGPCSWAGSPRRCARPTAPWSAPPTRAAAAPSPSADVQPRKVRSHPQSLRLAVIAGDGIGPEVVAEGLKVLRAAVTASPPSRPPSTTSAPGAGTRPARRCPTRCWPRSASTTRSCSARSATRACRAACSSGGCCSSCASSSTTTSTCARRGSTRASTSPLADPGDDRLRRRPRGHRGPVRRQRRRAARRAPRTRSPPRSASTRRSASSGSSATPSAAPRPARAGTSPWCTSTTC